MLSLTLWAVVVTIIAVLTTTTLRLGESSWTGGVLAAPGRRAAAGVAALVALAVLALLLRWQALADVDGHVVRRLDDSRGASLDRVMPIVTTIGDAIPTFTIAAALAVLVHRRGVHTRACWLLPAVVLLELGVQVLVGDVLHPLDITDVVPDLPLGGAGYVPSGSIARLTSLTLLGGLLLRPGGAAVSRRVLDVGAVAVVVEAVSRLYLGRHLVLDLVGGFLLGLALFAVTSLVITGSRRPSETPGTPAKTRPAHG